MSKYYISNENSWQSEKDKQAKIGRGIDVLYTIDRYLDRAFEELEYDKYGLMSRNAYSSKRARIQECEKKNDALYNYARSIHEQVADKDFDFFKQLNKVYEELSLLDINEYTTKNTLGITEKKSVPTGYYTGSMASQSGNATGYEIKDVPKSKINLYEIQMKCDVFQIEKQLQESLKESGETLTDKELQEAKTNFYKGTLNTSFEHTVYANGFIKGLSNVLDFVPVVGGVKNVIEGCSGYTMTGEKLKDGERVSYAIFGTLSTVIDVVTLGTASGLIQGGKFIGKEAAKASIKQVGKVALQQTTGAVIMGWTSQFASEKLRDMGLSAEEIFAIHVIVGVTVVGVSKYKKTSKVEMPEISSKFNYKSKYDEVEFTAQLKNQEKGLNDLTISEFVENRKKFNELGRSKEATNLQKELREQFKQDKIEELLRNGSNYEDAVNETEKWMKTQAVLHDPDQIAGGNPLNLTGLGDKNINSSIGSQWRYRIDDLEKQIMDFANTIPKSEWDNVKLNIKLTY